MESDMHYAQRQVRQFKTSSVAQIVAPGCGDSKLLVSRLRRETPGHGFATPSRSEPVFSILVQLRQQERRELYLNDKLVHQGSFAARTVSVVDHRKSPKANLLTAFDTIIFTVPQATLDDVADELGVKNAPTLTCENEGRLDDTVWSLAQTLLPALARPNEVGSMYAERVLLASTTYFAHAFGGIRPPMVADYKLSPRQYGRSIDLLHERLRDDISLSTLASEVDLTAGQFERAFRRTTGGSPDQWIRHQQVEQAKAMLRRTSLPLSQIAAACGFVGPEHLTRIFIEVVGVTPAEWKKQIHS